MRIDMVLTIEQIVKQLIYGLELDIDFNQTYNTLTNWNIRYSLIIDE